MINHIKFNGWKIVAVSTSIEHHTVTEMATVFISKDDDHFYLYDEADKIVDVSRMPHYISEDWINYNKRDLNTKILDKHIKEFMDVGLTDTEFIANELKSIKRDLLLKKII